MPAEVLERPCTQVQEIEGGTRCGPAKEERQGQGKLGHRRL